MKFGLEAEKFLFNTLENLPSNGVFRFLDALTDFKHYLGSDVASCITNEFVLNMVEINTHPSTSVPTVLKEYIFNYFLIQEIAYRENVTMVPLASLPMNYEPHMLPKWPYLVQNSILDQQKQHSWKMTPTSPLLAAGNCAGVHIHSEVQTPPEFLFTNRELQDKFNMGLMMTPMIAFASSPYFFGEHQAASMRGVKYYNEVYKKFPLNGGLPPVMESSENVLRFIQESIELWIERGTSVGFSEEDLARVTSKKGANWNPIRWNRAWNTIEIRCLESDRIDLDCSKFIWITNAMKRLDLKGEALKCRPQTSQKKLDKGMIEECFSISGGEVSILSTAGIYDLFSRAVSGGTKDPLVEAYLHRLADFSFEKMESDTRAVFNILKKVLASHETTSMRLLLKTDSKSKIDDKMAHDLVNYAIEEQKKVIKVMRGFVPDVFEKLDQMHHHIN
jgi:hypothetical protein